MASQWERVLGPAVYWHLLGVPSAGYGLSVYQLVHKHLKAGGPSPAKFRKKGLRRAEASNWVW